MARFEKVSKWADSDINMPVRKTAHSAGYDFEAVKDILIEPYQHLSNIIMNSSVYEPKTLSGANSGNGKAKITFVGIK